MNFKNITILFSSLFLCTSICFAASMDKTVSSSVPTNTSGALQAKSIVSAEAIVINNAWARPSFVTKGASNNAAVYLELTNNSDTDYNLIGWKCPEITDIVELHLSYVELGNSKMRALDKLAIPSHSSVLLKPLGLHIMLKDCKKSLTIGEKFNLILQFDHNIEKTVSVEVKAG